jgi:hypothetical protein
MSRPSHVGDVSKEPREEAGKSKKASMKRLVLLGAATLVALPVLASAQPVAPTPRSNDASGGTLTQATPWTEPGAPRAQAVDPAALRDGFRTSKVVGSSVYNDANDDIGKVDDIIIPRRSGGPAAVISVGGFLGMGSHYVAVPFDQLHLGPQDRWTLPGATKEYLKTLPPFSYDTTPTRG